MLFGRIGSNGCCRIPPLKRRGRTSQRGTTQLEFSSGQTTNVHLPPFEFSLANNTDPLIVKRIPTAERIAYAQDREPIIEINMSDHMQRAVCSSHRHNTIGPRADCVVGQNPTRRLPLARSTFADSYSGTSNPETCRDHRVFGNHHDAVTNEIVVCVQVLRFAFGCNHHAIPDARVLVDDRTIDHAIFPDAHRRL